jgi:hypothetical protein
MFQTLQEHTYKIYSTKKKQQNGKTTFRINI